MTSLVLAGSAALSCCFADETTAADEALLDRVRLEGAVVPRIWRLEVLNGLLMGERRGRIQPNQTATFIMLFSSLPLLIDDEMEARAFGDILYVARANRLSAYDAAYLELAVRRALPLATLDRELARAAERSGVPLPLRRT